MEEKSFLDELIEMAEEKELMQTEAYYDLLLLEIKKINDKIESNFKTAEQEAVLINQWAINKNTTLNERKLFVEKKLESYLRERGEKSISLCNGTLKMHKKQDKIEITDMDLFLKHAHKELLDIVPETVKASVAKIKQWIKSKPVPKGVTVVIGKPEFSYKLNDGKENVEDEEIGIESERKESLRVAV